MNQNLFEKKIIFYFKYVFNIKKFFLKFSLLTTALGTTDLNIYLSRNKIDETFNNQLIAQFCFSLTTPLRKFKLY